RSREFPWHRQDTGPRLDDCLAASPLERRQRRSRRPDEPRAAGRKGHSVIKVMTDAVSYDGYRKYTAEVASNYERDRQVEAHWWKEDAFIREHFRDRPAARLLDIPVGTGRFLPHYKRAQTVVGVDVSDDMLIEARR